MTCDLEDVGWSGDIEQLDTVKRENGDVSGMSDWIGHEPRMAPAPHGRNDNDPTKTDNPTAVRDQTAVAEARPLAKYRASKLALGWPLPPGVGPRS